MKKAASADDLELTILANQNFRDGSFTPMTAPAVCPEFTVEEVDGVGEANITMYPVADYLNVAIEGTAPIKTLTLSMSSDEAGETPIYLAGTAKLTPVGSKDAGYAEGFRQYLTVPADPVSAQWSTDITLTCGQLTDALCHTEKEYMFVIPANVVAKAKNTPVYVKIVVNKGEENEVTFTKELVYTDARPRLSNMIFNVNDGKDKDGNIIPLMYNPSNAVIIKDQLDLLTYIREYNAGTKADAFLCSVAELDFSRDAMIKISTEMGGQNADISNYLANGFPCIESFSNTITGNGAVIKDVQIDDMNGIFGELAEKAVISGITFENVTAAKDKDVYGVLLTKDAAVGAKIEDITIKNCTASAIFGEVRPSGLAKLNVVVDEGQNKNISSVAEELRMNEDLALKNVTDFNVSGPLFGKVGLGSAHRVLSVEEACEVSDLLGSMVANTEGGAYSILIAGTSYWTGGAVQATKTNTKGEVEILYAEQLAYAAQNGATSVILMNNMELNGSIVEKDNHPYIWKRDSANAIASINGNGKTVSDVYMQSSEAGGVQADLAPFTADAISNLTVDGVKIYIITDEDTFVPAKVAGLSLKSNSVSKVTVNNIDIEGVYDGLNKGDIAYAASMQPHVGLLLAEAEDAQLNECVVAGTSNIKGYIGSLVGYATLNVAEKEMQVYDCTATLSIDTDAVRLLVSATETLQLLDNDYNTSYYGQPIGVLKNASGAARTIRFKGNVTPVMFLDKDNSNGAINVVVNDAQVK